MCRKFIHVNSVQAETLADPKRAAPKLGWSFRDVPVGKRRLGLCIPSHWMWALPGVGVGKITSGKAASFGSTSRGSQL